MLSWNQPRNRHESAEWRLWSKVWLTSCHKLSCSPLKLPATINSATVLKGHGDGLGRDGGSANEKHWASSSCCCPAQGGCPLPDPAICHIPAPTLVSSERCPKVVTVCIPLLIWQQVGVIKSKELLLRDHIKMFLRPVCSQRWVDFQDTSVRVDIIFLLTWGHLVWHFLFL